LTQRSGTLVTDMPPEQFGEKKPNFNLLLFRMGDCFRPMKPQSNPIAGFYPINNLRIMPENSNCSSLVDDEAVEVQACRRRSRTSPGDAVDGQCRFFGLVPLERKKEVAHLQRHPRSKNDPGGEKPL
jgi:hypothetical protein